MMPVARKGEVRTEKGPSGGAMGDVFNAVDWNTTPLGDVSSWPQSLRTALDICLNSPGAAALVWGPARTFFYNARYRLLCSVQPPEPLGKDFAASSPEIWSIIHAPFEQALAGQTASSSSQPLVFATGPEPRECLLSFTCIPVSAESGSIGGVFIDVTDESPRTELERAQNDLNAFHYAISHDLRSPLRTQAQLGRLRLEELTAELPDSIRDFLQQFIRAAEKMDERAQGLLSFGRTSRQPLKRQRVHVHALVSEAIAVLRNEHKGRSIETVVHPLPDAMGDAEMIRKLFFITLSNAFKFTRNTEPARVEIGARAEEHQIVYFIADNGAGFDMKYARKLFGLYQRMHSESEFEGAGVGLALARRIVERHGGKIWAEASKGQGAKFCFTLPGAL